VRWDADTLKELPRLSVDSRQDYTSMGLYALPDGKKLLSAYQNGCIKVWDAQSGKELPISDRYGASLAMALSPDGRTVAVADETGRIDLRNSVTGVLIRTLNEPGDAEYAPRCDGGDRTMVFNPGGDLLAINESRLEPVTGEKFFRSVYRIRLIRVADGVTLRKIEEDVKDKVINVRPIGFSPDSKRLLLDFSIIPLGNVRWWDIATGELDAKLPTSFYRKSLSPDGTTLAANMKGEVLLSDPVTSQIRKRIVVEPTRKSVVGYCFGWSADGRTLVCVIPGDIVVVLDPTTGRERHRFEAFPGDRPQLERAGSSNAGQLIVEWVELSPDGKWVVTTGSDSVGLWEVATGKLLTTFDTGVGPGRPSFTPENRDLLIFGNGIGRRWNLVATLSPNPKATPTELWGGLSNKDAEQAVRAANGLVATSAGRELLREKVPAMKIDVTADQVKKWIADLGNDDFSTRETAEKELSSRARLWEALLRESSKSSENPEIRTRLQRLLAPLENNFTKEELRAIRLVRAAEMGNTTPSIELLKTWSEGASGAILTEDAKAALGRIDRHKTMHK
jgi:WD40 repeat protein